MSNDRFVPSQGAQGPNAGSPGIPRVIRRQPYAIRAEIRARSTQRSPDSLTPRTGPPRSRRPREASSQERGQPPSQSGGGCLTGGLLGLLSFLIVALLLLSGALMGYATVARDLPSSSELVQRTNQFQTTRIYDRNGQLLQAPLAPDDPQAGLRQRVALDAISSYLVQATVATEDANFYRHPGIDPVGLSRAIFRAIQNRGPVVGTSTISQQLVKLVYLSPERTIGRKVKEAILAAEITRRYDKDTVLELYLNEIYYGNLAYGIEAASQLYFNVPARDLTLAQAALLAGLPQSPATYDPLQNPSAAKARQADVLRLMVEAGYITPQEADAAWEEQLTYYGQGREITFLDRAPHFVMFVRSQIEQLYGPEVLYRGGLQVYTTLDSERQQQAEDAVSQGIERLRGANASNAALVALLPGTGEILAMVGSVDFEDPEIDGQVNVALAPRQPGSAIKPFTYLTTFEHPTAWWTPATLIDDVRTEFDDGPGRPPYVPVNYDGREHGRVSVRTALANSYNIPAVKALEHVGVEAFLEVATRFSLATLTREGHPPYGLSLTLGGGETNLLELTGAYAALASGGRLAPAGSVLCILDAEGQVVERLDVPGLPTACQEAPLAANALVAEPLLQQVARAEHAYLLTDILKDNEARAPTFGANSALRLDRPAAAKTGTTNDVRDGWTIGYTPDLATGVWVGNSDGTPMNQSLSGSQAAAPIWKQFMTSALNEVAPRDFLVPEGIEFVEICTLTGGAVDSTCPPDQRRTEVFASSQLPAGADRSQVQVLIAYPQDGQIVQGVIPIIGSATIPDFDHYLVEYGESHAPGAWGRLAGPVYQQMEAGELALWDVQRLPKDGPHVVRVVAVDKQGVRVESPAVRVMVVQPMPTSEPTPTATVDGSLTATPSPTPSPTSTPTLTATTTPSPLGTPTPSTTPTPPGALEPSPGVTPTEPPTPAPTATATPGDAGSPLPTPTATPTSETATPRQTPQPEPPLVAVLVAPISGETISGQVMLRGQASGVLFLSYQLDYSQRPASDIWQPLDPTQPLYFIPNSGILGAWDTTQVTNGVYSLRLLVQGTDGKSAETRIEVIVDN